MVNSVRRSARDKKPSYLALEAAANARIAPTPLTQQARVKKAAGRPKKNATAAPAPKKGGRKAKKPATSSALKAEESSGDDEPEVTSTKAVKKAKAKANPKPKIKQEIGDESSTDEEPQVTSTRSVNKRKGKTNSVPKIKEEGSSDEEPQVTSTQPVKKARAKSNAVSKIKRENSSDDEPQVTSTRPVKKGRGKSNAVPNIKKESIVDDEVQITSPKSVNSGHPTGSQKRKYKYESEDESANEPEPSAPKIDKGKGRAVSESSVASDSTRNATGVPAAKRARTNKTPAVKAAINKRPAERLNVYVMGEGFNSELGLGPERSSIHVKRPRLNLLLDAENVGVVSIACGGMHTLALTRDGIVLSWGVNDNGALGRYTALEGASPYLYESESEDSDDEDSGLEPNESSPTQVLGFGDDNIVKVAAGDSISLALTDDGRVYGWGTFRNQSGVLGFYQDPSKINRRGGFNPTNVGLIDIQPTPRLYTELSKIIDIVCGSNHCMALSQSGQIYIWGCGEQNQLGHHINERIDVEGKACLVPSMLRTGRRKYKAIFTGADHSFAMDVKNQVFSWGLNSFGATGIPEGAGEDTASVFTPTLVKSLNTNSDDPVTFMCGGQHHTIAITATGAALVFGRADGMQTGLDLATLPTNSIIFDAQQPPRPRILMTPTRIPGVGSVQHASAGIDHSIVVNSSGQAWGWGMNASFQLGLGTNDDVRVPHHIINTAVRGEFVTWSGCGGQYSMLASPW